jgi:hypothetical protein
VSATGAGTGNPSTLASAEPVTREPGAARRRLRHLPSWSSLVAPALGVLYLILMAHQLDGAIRATNLDADAASGPVIGELFGAAPAHANIVLGEFGWYATLLFDLATKWLPHHRQVWEVAPYVMALAAAALAAWSVWQVAGARAAGLTAVALACASPATLRLELSTTQHAPDWFCLALLGTFLIWLQGHAARVRWPVLIAPVLIIGVIVGVNAKSDVLLAVAALAPFGLALIATAVRVPGPGSRRALVTGLATLVVAAVAWHITAVAMAKLAVAPEPGLKTTQLAASKAGHNFTLWWKSIAVLGNGDFFDHALSPRTVLAFACAVVSIAAVVSVPWLTWRALRGHADIGTPSAPQRHAFYVFWCASAILLTLAFLVSAAPVDIHADRYLVGLLYAGATVVPAATAARPRAAAAVIAGTCVFALGGVVSLARGAANDRSEFHTPVSTGVAAQIARIAAREHLTVGYAGYWDAAPVTWATRFRVQVYPVAVCDGGARLCRFDLHFISSWYEPRPGTGSFLLTDNSSSQSVTTPTPDLGRPTAVYRIGSITMYAYRYDLAARIVS